MIKAENGKVFIHGNAMAIRKEFVTIVQALKENLGEDALREDFDFIMDDKFSKKCADDKTSIF